MIGRCRAGIIVGLCFLSGCSHQKGEPEKKKNYFKRDEFKQSKTFRLVHHMNYDELKSEKDRLHKCGNDFIAVKFLRQMIKKCENPDELRSLRLEYAGMLYDLKQFGESAEEYKLFVTLYPGSSQAAYADYRTICALNREVLTADRDQEKTEAVVDLSKEYAKKAQWRSEYNKYLKEVEDMTHDCLYRLYESEMLRFYFYINRQQCQAALKRLEYIKEHYLPYLPEIESAVLELDYELCCERKAPDEGAKKKAELNKKFPQYKMSRARRREYAKIF